MRNTSTSRDAEEEIKRQVDSVDGVPDDRMLVALCVIALDYAATPYSLLSVGRRIRNERSLTTNDRGILRTVYLDNKRRFDAQVQRRERPRKVVRSFSKRPEIPEVASEPRSSSPDDKQSRFIW